MEGREKNKIQFVYSMKVRGFAECMRHRRLVRSESWEVSPRLNDKQEALVTMDGCDVFFCVVSFLFVYRIVQKLCPSTKPRTPR